LDTSQFFTRNSILLILLGFGGALIGLLFAGAGMAYADKAEFCGGCHSMQHQYQTWQVSNHKQFTCGDCHLPQDKLTAKIYTKTKTGMHDTYHEVLRDYPQNIPISASGKAIVDKNCVRCHSTTVENTFMAVGGQNCIKCHRSVPHGQYGDRGGVPVE
jgi:cytochrome c nitrite reductase small subunit